jgi:hypothetical protein
MTNSLPKGQTNEEMRRVCVRIAAATRRARRSVNWAT